ncbi:MAG: hypothetical protein U0869_24415 [Chloroflexota bacterium]
MKGLRTVPSALALVAVLTGGCALLADDGTTPSASTSPGPTASSDPPSPMPRPWLTTWSDHPTEPLMEFWDAAAVRCVTAQNNGDIPIQDQRGPDGAAFVWVKEGMVTECLLLRQGGAIEVFGPTFSGSSPSGVGDSSGVSITEDEEPPLYRVTLEAVRVGPGASRIALGAADGVHAVATVQDGWAVAWWPAPLDPSPTPFP